jgi:hypothetical protein
MEDRTSLGYDRFNRWNNRRDVEGLTGLAHPRALFQKRNGSPGQATIVDKFIAHSTASPASAKEGDVPVQSLFADLAKTWLDTQQHRLPIATGLSNAHEASILKPLDK